MMKNILVKPFQLQSLRAFATASVRSKPYTKPQVLQGPMTFSKMEILNPKDIANATLGADKILSFEELRIFPSVRHAMIEEIKLSYDLKSTYVKDKTELIIKPTVAQIAAIRKMNQVRDTHAKKIQKKQEESFKGNTSRKIFKELILENELNRLKVFNFAAETGSGKTWAFLATLLSKLKEDDVAMFTKSQKKYEEALAERCVRSVILVPTVEMIDQIHGVLTRANQYEFPDSDNKVPGAFKDFLAQPSESRLNIRAFKWCSGVAHTDLFNYIKKHGRVDVLITTPYKLASLEKLVNIERPFQYFNATKYLIIDEADTLMHHNFLTQSEVVLRHLRRLTDIVMCSATVTKDYASTLRKMFPGENSVINIHTQQVHKLLKNIRVKMINSSLAPYNRSKEKCLAQAVYAIYNEGTEAGYVKRMIVFVNLTDAVEPLVTSLTTEFGHRPQDIIGVTGNNTLEDRRARIRPFVEPPVKLEDQADQAKIKVLITTDLLARGVDFNGVKSIINFDLPRRSSDMMHRCGRTGRMGQSGTVYMIVENKTKNSWVKGMKSAIKKRATVL